MNIITLYKKNAFSLAEVLITIGVIGIVAAMTIPNLVSNYQKEQTVNQLKSVYATLNNALEQAKVENGTDVNSWYISNTSDGDASAYFAQNYLLPFLKTTKICGNSTVTECVHKIGFISNLTDTTKKYHTISGVSSLYSFTLINGPIIGISIFSISGTSVSNCRVLVYFDINGKKAPNLMGKDAFLVELGGNGGAGDKNKFIPYGSTFERNDLLSSFDVACNKSTGSGLMCFALIMKDGWKIADDYPWN